MSFRSSLIFAGGTIVGVTLGCTIYSLHITPDSFWNIKLSDTLNVAVTLFVAIILQKHLSNKSRAFEYIVNECNILCERLRNIDKHDTLEYSLFTSEFHLFEGRLHRLLDILISRNLITKENKQELITASSKYQEYKDPEFNSTESVNYLNRLIDLIDAVRTKILNN